MKVKYFEDTDTLFIQLSDSEIAETRDLNENVVMDVDSQGKVVNITIEHARAKEGKLDFSYETIAA